MIAFSGLDGAGKSTQIELIKQYYTKRDFKVKVFWNRIGYTPGLEKLKSILRKFNTSVIPKNRGMSKDREQTFSRPIIRKIWLCLSIIDLIFFYSIYIRTKELFGTIVICDRYLFDSLIDIQLNFPQENVSNWWLWKLLCFFAVKPKKHFVLTIPVSESQKRSKLKKEPFPDTEEALRTRLNKYVNFIEKKNNNVVGFDGFLPINEIHMLILKEINK